MTKPAFLSAVATVALLAGAGAAPAGSGGFSGQMGHDMAGQMGAAADAAHDAADSAMQAQTGMHGAAEAMHDSAEGMRDAAHDRARGMAGHGDEAGRHWREVARAQAGLPAYTGKFRDQIYLMDHEKMTLYTFAGDRSGVSSCTGACAEKWPPVIVTKDTKLPRGYSRIKRADGRLQLAYHGKPLYRWIKDRRPGEMTGDGVKGQWHIARP